MEMKNPTPLSPPIPKDQKKIKLHNDVVRGSILMPPHKHLRYDLPNGFTYLQLGRDFINLFSSPEHEPNFTGMIPGWSSIKVVQTVTVGCISRSRGQ